EDEGLLDTSIGEKCFGVLSPRAGQSGVRHEHIGVAEAPGHQSLHLRDFVTQVGRPQDVRSPACELALDDETPRQTFPPIRLPRTRKRAVASAVAGIQERLDGLAEDLPRDGEAELLET